MANERRKRRYRNNNINVSKKIISPALGMVMVRGDLPVTRCDAVGGGLCASSSAC